MGYGAWATRPPVYEYTQCREKICIFKPCSIFLYITIKNEHTSHMFAHPPLYICSPLYIRSPLHIRSPLYIHEYSRIPTYSLILYSMGVYEPPVPISTYYRGRFTICQVFSLFIFFLTHLYL